MTVSDQLDPLIQKLVDRLNADDPVTRRNAAGSLRLHGERAVGAIPELVKRLADEDPEVRNEVRRALDRLQRAAAA
jgi:HEAT repeat protein